MNYNSDNEKKDLNMKHEENIIGEDNYNSINASYEVKEQPTTDTPIIAGISVLLACEYKNKYKKDITDKELYELLKNNTKDLNIKGMDKMYGGL